MPFPSLGQPEQLPEAIRHELESFISLLTGYLSQQHDDTGAHADVTATSIAVAGDASIAGTVTIAPTVRNDTVPPLTVRGFNNTTINNVLARFQTSTGSTSPGTFRFGRYADATDTLRFDWDPTAVQAIWQFIVASGEYWWVNSSGNQLFKVTDSGLYERDRATPMGNWTSVAYASGNFTASGAMTWTVDSGDQSVYAYTLIGKTMLLRAAVDTSSVGGVASTDLRIAIPGSFTSSGISQGYLYYSDNGTRGVGLAQVDNGTTYVRCLLPSLGNWAASANNTSVYISLAIQVA